YGRVEGISEACQIGPYAINPDRVGIDMKKMRVAEFQQSLLDASAGTKQQSALVGNHDLRTVALCQMLQHLFCHVMHINDHTFNACLVESIEHMVDQWLSGKSHQRLRH